MQTPILSLDETSLLNSYLSLFPSTISAQKLRDKFQETIQESETRPINLLSRRNTCAYIINPHILELMLKVLKNETVQFIMKGESVLEEEPTNYIVSSDTKNY